MPSDGNQSVKSPAMIRIGSPRLCKSTFSPNLSQIYRFNNKNKFLNLPFGNLSVSSSLGVRLREDEARLVGLAGGVVAGRFCLTGSFLAGSADFGLPKHII